ncbi:MAG: hypothetical protein J6H21_01800 [Firmicutes bacterium]|nr:hypothetical protein [Bacillota bacterium]
MSIQNAKSTLKILGILSVILGIFGVIAGLGLVAGGGLFGADTLMSGKVTTADGAETVSMVTGMVMAMGIFTAVSALVDVLLGVFSVRASKDFSKINPAYILSIIALALSVISLFMNFAEFNLSTLLSALPSIVFSAVLFLAAKTVKEENTHHHA